MADRMSVGPVPMLKWRRCCPILGVEVEGSRGQGCRAAGRGGPGEAMSRQGTRQRLAGLELVDNTPWEEPVWAVQGAAAGDPVTGRGQEGSESSALAWVSPQPPNPPPMAWAVRPGENRMHFGPERLALTPPFHSNSPMWKSHFASQSPVSALAKKVGCGGGGG